MDSKLFLRTPPPLDPVWLKHEQQSNLLHSQPIFASIIDRRQAYSRACRDRNTALLAGRDSYLAHGLTIHDSTILAPDGHHIPIRTYKRDGSEAAEQPHQDDDQDLVIYYHGGGLQVGDLDSEDLSCRRICKDASTTVISVAYRLASDHDPTLAVQDAYAAFVAIAATMNHPPRSLVLVGSSAGGLLAAQVSQLARDNYTAAKSTSAPKRIDGLLLRCPVTCDASHDGADLPPQFRPLHTSFSPAFETSLGKADAGFVMARMSNLPLRAESFEGLPRTFFQLCTNDVFYSDGVCYAKALGDAGVLVQMDVLEGWPHTFWLKAPQLERALEAEVGMIEGLKWLQGRL